LREDAPREYLSSNLSPVIHYSREVSEALRSSRAIVALESTIISHGLPRPTNLEVAREVEEIVRRAGAVPATIAIIGGEIHVGMELNQLEIIANDLSVVKASIRDLPLVITKKLSAATTVAATSHIAHQAGIHTFATGGLGGVHRDARDSWDESADLHALANIPITIICAGVKSILDVPATLERLESLSVPVVGFQTQDFPGFYLRSSGFKLEYSAESADEVAEMILKKREFGSQQSGFIVAHAVKDQMNPTLHESLLKSGLALIASEGISGKEVTPFLLEYFHRASDGESLRVNIEIIKSNAQLAAEIAISLQRHG